MHRTTTPCKCLSSSSENFNATLRSNEQLPSNHTNLSSELDASRADEIQTWAHEIQTETQDSRDREDIYDVFSLEDEAQYDGLGPKNYTISSVVHQLRHKLGRFGSILSGEENSERIIATVFHAELQSGEEDEYPEDDFLYTDRKNQKDDYFHHDSYTRFLEGPDEKKNSLIKRLKIFSKQKKI